MHALALPSEFRETRRRRRLESVSPVNEPVFKRPDTRPALVGLVTVYALGRRYQFTPIRFLNVVHQHGRFVARDESIGVMGFGDTIEEAVDEFVDAFDFQYRQLVEEHDPDQLTEKASAIREHLRSVVAVEPS